MGRNVGCHTDGNAGGTIDQKIREAGRENRRFFFGFIKVRYEIHRILVDVRKKLHGNLRKAGLRISHGCRAVAVHGTEVSMSVHQGISLIPLLGHIDQRTVDGAVAVGMILTHGVTDNTR